MANILIVDDSPSILQLVSFTLEADGHNCLTASDGSDGLSKAKAQQFDLILTDRNMPNMNGIELVEALRQLTNYKTVPILMLTTESSQAKKMEGKSAGISGWLVKPFQPDALRKSVSRAF